MIRVKMPLAEARQALDQAVARLDDGNGNFARKDIIHHALWNIQQHLERTECHEVELHQLMETLKAYFGKTGVLRLLYGGNPIVQTEGEDMIVTLGGGLYRITERKMKDCLAAAIENEKADLTVDDLKKAGAKELAKAQDLTNADLPLMFVQLSKTKPRGSRKKAATNGAKKGNSQKK